jgi:hypothetical protein
MISCIIKLFFELRVEVWVIFPPHAESYLNGIIGKAGGERGIRTLGKAFGPTFA